MRSPRRILCLICLGLSLVWGCSAPSSKEEDGTSASSESSSELPAVRVAINTWPGLGPYYVAQERGFDREEGIRLEVVMTENTEARRSSLLSGEVDLVGITLDTVVIARSRGVPMVVVGKSDISYGGDGILAKAGITKVADLAGKRVACPEGLPSHFLLLYLLREEGLGPDDIELVPADDGGQAAFLFTSGEVDAAVTWDPWIRNAQALTDGNVLVTTRDVPGLLLGVVAANANFLDERVDLIAATLRAWFKAVAFTREHPDEAAEIMARHYNVPVGDFQSMLGGAKLADLADTLETFGTEENPGPVVQLAEDASELWLAAGVIERPVAPSEVVSWSVIKRLRATR